MRDWFRIGLFVLILVFTNKVIAQRVGINQDSIDQSALFEIYSDSFGILIPRLDSLMIYSIPDPATSLLLYQKDGKEGFRYYQDSTWKRLGNDKVKLIEISPSITDPDSIKAFIEENGILSEVLYYSGELIAPTDIWFYNGDSSIRFNNPSFTSNQYSNYSELRADSFAINSRSIIVKDFTYDFINEFTSQLESYTTIGGVFYYNNCFENGGTCIGGWQRVWNGIDVYPEWWEVGGYDEDGNIYENDLRQRGIQCDYDRVVASNELFENDNRGVNINLPNGRFYIQHNKIFSPYANVTINGNGATIKRADAIANVVNLSPIGSNQYTIDNINHFRIGMPSTAFFGTNNGEHARSTPSQGNSIVEIVGNVVTMNLENQNEIPAGSKFQRTHSQINYENNVTMNNLTFDGNKDVINATESWNFVNCMKSTNTVGLVLNDCHFEDMPSDCITVAGETWINGGSAKRLNACFVHGSSGGLINNYKKKGIFISNFKADSICLSSSSANGHAGTHGFYTQSIGTNAIKIVNSRVTNVLEGGIFSPLTSHSDEFSLVDSYIENANFILTNSSTSNIVSTKIKGNTLYECGLTSIGAGVNGVNVYQGFEFTNNLTRNSLFHFNGISEAIVNDNHFILDSVGIDVDFTSTELTQASSYNSVLSVGGIDVDISNNTFTSYFNDSLANVAIRFNVGNVGDKRVNLSISNNKIYDFSTGIQSLSGGTTAVRHNISISNNYIEVLENPSHGLGEGIRTYFQAKINSNQILNLNSSPSIKIYGHNSDPITELGCFVTNNIIWGSDYSRMIDVIYRNNLIEGNLLEGGIGFQNSTIQSQNILGDNRQFNRNSKIVSDIYGN